MCAKKTKLLSSYKLSKHKKTAKTSIEAQQLFRQIFHSVPAAILLTRLSDGLLADANPAFLKLTGHALDELIGLSSVQAGIVMDASAREERLAALKQGQTVPDFEVQVTTKSGDVREGLATVGNITLAGEQFALTTFIDITDRNRAERQLAQMKRLYATLSQVNQTIVRTRESSQLYQSICDVAVQFGEFSLAWVGLLDESSGEIRPVAARGLDVAQWPFELVNIHQGKSKDGLAATAIRTSNVVTSEDVQADQRVQNVHVQIQQLGFHSSAVVPFQLKGNTIGMLGLVSTELGLFKAQEEVLLLKEMGLDISFALDMMAVEAAREYAEQQVRTHATRLKILADASKTFAQAGQDYQVLLDQIVRLIVNTMADICQIRLLSEDGKQLELVAIDSLDPELSTTLRRLDQPTLDVTNDMGLATRVVRTGQPVLLSNITLEQLWASNPPEYRSIFKRFAPHSFILVPLRVHGRNIGGLGISRYRSQQSAFTEDDLNLTQDLADRAALAIHSAQLFQQVQRELTERKQVEATRDRLASIVDASEDAILSKTLDGIITSWNRGSERLYGYSAEEAVGQSISLIIPPDRPTELKDILNHIQRGEHVQHYETIRVRKNGTSVDISITVSPMLDADDNIIGASAIARDISERKRMEEKLHSSEAMLKLFVEYAPAAIAMFDDNMQYIAASRRYLHDYALVDENIVGRSHYEIFPEITVRWKEIHQRCLAGATERAEEDPFPRADGTLDWVRWEIRPWSEKSGQIGGLLLFSEVITKRKNAEIALAESEAHYRQIIETAQEGVWVVDAENRTTLANQRLADMFGYTIEEMMHKSIYEFMDEEGKAMANANFANRMEGIYKQPDFKYRRKDGGAVWAIAGISELQDQTGKHIGALTMLTDITERKWAEGKIQTQLQHLKALRDVDIAISASFGMKISLDAVVSRAVVELNVDAADILVLNPDSTLLEYRAGWGFYTKDIQDDRLHIGEGTAGRCARDGAPIYIHNLHEHVDEFLRKSLLTEENFIGYYCVPLINRSEVKGVLEIFHRSELEPDSEWFDFLQTLAGQAAIAIEKSTLFEGLQRSNKELAQAYDATILGWSRAMDLRDKETAGHTQRVTEVTLELAKTIGMSDEEMVHIRRGALLHDMGKLGVPDHILLKPGKLTDDEWVAMRMHPQYAYDMLSFIQYLRPALDIPYCHHEKWNGTGYPRGLKGEEIPLAARLFAVVDVWDALRSDRPYRPSWPQEKVLEYIRAESGTHFDPLAVDVFLQVMSRKQPYTT